MKRPGQDLEVKNNTELRNEIVTAMMQKFKSLIPGNIYQQYEEELKVIKRELLVEAINLNLRKFDIKAEEKYNQIMQKFRVLLEHDTEDSDTIIKNLPDSYSQFRAELLEKKIEKIKNDPEIIEAEKFSKEVINRTQYLFYRFLNEVKKYFEGISSQEDLQIFEKKINGLIPSIGTGGVDKMLEIIENHYNHGVKQARKFLNELQKSTEEKNNTNITELINFDGYFLTFEEIKELASKELNSVDQALSENRNNILRQVTAEEVEEIEPSTEMKDGGIRIIARVLRTLQRQEVIKGEEEMMQLIKYTLAKIIEAEHICTQALNDGREISFQDTYQQEGSIMLDLFEEEIYFSFLEIINELKNNKDYYCPKNILQIHGPRDAIEDIIAENKDLPKFFGDFIRGIDFNFESKTKYAIEIAAQGLIEQSFIEGVSRVKETYKEDLFDEVNRTIYNLQDEAIEAIKFYEDLSKKDEASFSQEDKEIYSNQKKFIAALESLQSDLGNYNFAIIYTDQYAKGDLKPEQIEGLNFIKEYSCKNGYIDPLPNNTEAALRPIVKRFYVLSS